MSRPTHSTQNPKAKSTPVGEIPVDWEYVPLCKTVDILTGFPFSSKTYSSEGYLLCRGDNIGVGKVKWNNPKRCNEVTEQTVLKFSIKENDILLAMDRTWINDGVKMAVATDQEVDSLLVQRVARIRCSDPTLSKFISAHFNTKRFECYIKGSQQEGGGVPHISKAQISSYAIPLPPLPEQEKIAEILGTWDRAIETQQKLIDSLTRRKKALAQQLLTGKTRLPEFEGSPLVDTRWGQRPQAWKLCKIGDIAKQSSLKNKENKAIPVLSCTKHHGLVDSLSYFKKRVFSDDLTPYRVVNRGDFVYATNHIEEGSIGYQDIHDTGLVSPMYTVFGTDKSVSADFLYPLLKTELYIHIYQAMTSASVDRRGSLRWNEFSKIPVAIPPLKEQQAIAKVLTTASQEIDLHTTHLTSLRNQKRGLMQQLLTGKTRVL